jgi:hypothetical protein
MALQRGTPEGDEIPLEICNGEYKFMEMVCFEGQGLVCIYKE